MKLKNKEINSYIPVIQNAVELFELYNVNLQLEILIDDLIKKRGSNSDDVDILAEINLAYKLQDMCKTRV